MMCAQEELAAWMEKLKPFESAISSSAREAAAAQAIKDANFAEEQAAAKAKKAQEKAAADAKKAEEKAEANAKKAEEKAAADAKKAEEETFTNPTGGATQLEL
jgi:hypothetical protein